MSCRADTRSLSSFRHRRTGRLPSTFIPQAPTLSSRFFPPFPTDPPLFLSRIVPQSRSSFSRLSRSLVPSLFFSHSLFPHPFLTSNFPLRVFTASLSHAYLTTRYSHCHTPDLSPRPCSLLMAVMVVVVVVVEEFQYRHTRQSISTVTEPACTFSTRAFPKADSFVTPAPSDGPSCIRMREIIIGVPDTGQ